MRNATVAHCSISAARYFTLYYSSIPPFFLFKVALCCKKGGLHLSIIGGDKKRVSARTKIHPVNESGHTYEWVTSHIWQSRVTQHVLLFCLISETWLIRRWGKKFHLVNESCHAYVTWKSILWMRYVTTHSCVWHESFVCDTFDSFIWVIQPCICVIYMNEWFTWKLLNPPKNSKMALRLSTKGSIPYILVLADSASIFTEITQYTLICLQWALAELQYKKCLTYRTNGSSYCTRLAFAKNQFLFSYTCVRP